MQTSIKGIIYACILIFSFSTNAATINETELKGRLAFELPRTWKITEFEVTMSQDIGSEASPLVRSRFEAKIKARDNFYKHNRWENGGIEIIQTIAKKGDELTMYGDATSTKIGTVWNVKFEFEKNVHKEGKTRDNFSSAAIILGSVAEKEFISKRDASRTKAAQKIANAEAARRAQANEIANAKANAAAARRAQANEVANAKANAQAIQLAAQNAEAQEKAQRELRYQQLLAKYNPKANPGRLSGRQNGTPAYSQYPLRSGDTYYFEINNPSAGSVKGGNPYYQVTSYLAGMALHAGIMTQKEKAIIKITVVRHKGSLLGPTKNGIKSYNAKKTYGGKGLLIQAVHDRDFNEVTSIAPRTSL